MLESPVLRWAFIRKIYSILTVQMVLTVAVGSLVVFVRPIAIFFSTTSPGLGLYIFLVILPFLGTNTKRKKKKRRQFFSWFWKLLVLIVEFFFSCLWLSAVSAVLLLAVTPMELLAIGDLHSVAQLHGGVDVRLQQR